MIAAAGLGASTGATLVADPATPPRPRHAATTPAPAPIIRTTTVTITTPPPPPVTLPAPPPVTVTHEQVRVVKQVRIVRRVHVVVRQVAVRATHHGNGHSKGKHHGRKH